jgi:hypothetical protein
MDDTAWDITASAYEKCADCMVHSGFEGTAVRDAMKNPLKALRVSLKGVKTDGEMAPDISLAKQRKAEYIFSRHVDEAMDQIKKDKELAKSDNRTAAAE